jgi:hypothetical protein
VNRVPLGLVLLSQGAINPDQLRQGLAAQRACGDSARKKIGECLAGLGLVSEQQVIEALAAQQHCPVFAPREPQALPQTALWPLALVESYRSVPVFYGGKPGGVYVGFLDQVNHSFLHAVEQMLNCHSYPCIITPRLFSMAVERQSHRKESEAIVIDQRQSSWQIALTVSNYGEQVQVRRCSIVACERNLWVRLHGPSESFLDLVFRRPSPSGEAPPYDSLD